MKKSEIKKILSTMTMKELVKELKWNTNQNEIKQMKAEIKRRNKNK